MIEIFIAIVMYILSKKSGASNAQAAMVGVGSGLAARYFSTQTTLGQNTIGKWNDSLSSYLGISSATRGSEPGQVVVDGKVVNLPPGVRVVDNADGSISLLDLAGRLVDTSGKVLSSWGGTGTAAVIGTAAITSDFKSYLPWIAGVGAIVLLSR